MTRLIDRAMFLSVMLLPTAMVMGCAVWPTTRLVNHGDRIAQRRFEALERTLLRIEAKIDQLGKP